MAASRGGVLIWSKLDQDLSEMDVRTFARIKKVIWDQLLATELSCIFVFCVKRNKVKISVFGQDKLVSLFPFVCRS